MYEETVSQLVKHLKNPNGWWRDKAQHLLVLRQDKSVVPALRNMVKNSDNELARFHALWTLEGLDALKMEMIKKLMKDSDYHMRIQAIRASESLHKKGHQSLVNSYKKLAEDPNVNVVIQAMLTLNKLGANNIKNIVKGTMADNNAKGVQVVGSQILEQIANKNKVANKNFTPEELELYNQGAKIYSTLCSRCHGDNGKGTYVSPGGSKDAPALADSKLVQEHPEYVVKTVLHGLKGPIKEETYAMNIMPAQKAHDDKWVASVISYVRNSMENKASFVTPEYVGKIREATAEQKKSYTYEKLMASIPHKLNHKNWLVTASSSASASPGLGSSSNPSAAFTLAGWKTQTSQKPGMWFWLDLRQLVNLTRIQFNSPRGMFPKQYIVQV
jgi:mono/diheme cytochrome c family protein